ncbi:MAG: ImmA/IrrE family metallo-endopeptidase [Clostridium sp.]|uniref:ImmA/IrrE family metallo-endopeptidase n=1 Tax=Clostridium sp. TaxID=1506 RepID=UPI003F3A132B
MYETLLNEAASLNVKVIEANLITRDGRCVGNKIAINKNLTTKEKACVLAEELGHFHKTVGDITDQKKIENRKQELIARRWSYKRTVGILDIIKAFENGCTTYYDVAEYLNVPQKFLIEVIDYYKLKHGESFQIDNYIIYFIPRLAVLKIF